MKNIVIMLLVCILTGSLCSCRDEVYNIKSGIIVTTNNDTLDIYGGEVYNYTYCDKFIINRENTTIIKRVKEVSE